MEKKNGKAKIAITVVVLLSTLAIVALGTFAWYTISNKGSVGIKVSMLRTGDEWPFEFIEMRDDDNWATIGEVMNASNRKLGDRWSKDVTLGLVHFFDKDHKWVATPASDCYQLRPISTYDLNNWYLPEYTGRGEVSNLVWADLETVGNINRYNPTPSEEGEDIPSNYVYYYDLWVRTLSKDFDYELHLNNPYSAESVDADMYEEYNYGTYVLPALVKGSNGKAVLSDSGFDMSTCMRIGFAIYDPTEENIASQSVTDYWIYEPNCDQRAKHFKQYGAGSAAGYDYQQGFTYVLGNGEGGNKSVAYHETLADGDQQTLLPSGEDAERKVASLADNDKKTIKQLHSSWRSDIDFSEVTSLDSTDIAEFGDFLCKYTGKESLQGIDTPKFAEITKGTPVHIRVYIWMEGQDIDCWNSSLKGSLKIGLEFRGDIASGSESK